MDEKIVKLSDTELPTAEERALHAVAISHLTGGAGTSAQKRAKRLTEQLNLVPLIETAPLYQYENQSRTAIGRGNQNNLTYRNAVGAASERTHRLSANAKLSDKMAEMVNYQTDITDRENGVDPKEFAGKMVTEGYRIV